MDLFGKSPRPVFNDEMKKPIIEEYGKKLFDWCAGETPLEDCIESVGKILESNSNWREDGFYLAKELEDEGYTADFELAEIFNDMWYEQHKALEKAIKKWVIDDNIVPYFDLGVECKFKSGRQNLTGTITGYHKEIAQYAVCVPGRGHTIEGTSRLLVDYEAAEPIDDLEKAV